MKRLLVDGLLPGGTGDVSMPQQKEVVNPSTTTSSSSSPLAEDEQRNKLTSQKALQAVTAEKEAALADLNSVERSLSDIFRRYENMKSTLEGFKKVSRFCRAEFRPVDSRPQGDQTGIKSKVSLIRASMRGMSCGSRGQEISRRTDARKMKLNMIKNPLREKAP